MDFFIRTVSARTENMYLRILKEMTYEQYESLIESINEELNEERKNTALNQNRTINKRIKTEVGEMRKYINYFIKNNKIIHGLGIGAILYGVLCLVFKLSDVLNVNEKIRIIGEYLNNVGISIIAAYVFLFFQNWVIFKREFLTIKYAKKFINLYLLKDCLILQEQLKLIENKIKSEAELNEGIARTCKKIRDELQLCLGTYKSVLSDNMYDKMNELLFDDCFFMIENRATGNLLNMSMRNILKDKMYYGKIDSIIEEIRLEYSNL